MKWALVVALSMAVGGGLCLVLYPFFPNPVMRTVSSTQESVSGMLSSGRTEMKMTAVPTSSARLSKQTYSLSAYKLLSGKCVTQQVALYTVKEWQGTGQETIKFKPLSAPWVLWWEWEPVSKLSSKFSIVLAESAFPDQWVSLPPYGDPGCTNHAIRDEQKEVTLTVMASGVKWRLRVGQESPP